MAERLHLLVTDEEPYGWSVQSPQLPGFVGGRATETELKADLSAMLRFAGAQAGRMVIHHVRRFTSPEGVDYTVRAADDEHYVERLEVARRIEAAMVLPGQRVDMLDDAPRAVTGEVPYICAVPEDALGWIVEQMDPRGDTVHIAAAVAAEAVFTTTFAHGHQDVGVNWRSLAELGWSLDTTVHEVMLTVGPSTPRVPRTRLAVLV